VRIGAVFPQVEIGTEPADIARWATEVERLGYQHILAYDHVLGAGTSTRPGWRGYTSDDLFHEVFVLLGYLAAITSAVELTTGVLILPQRQTALVAKQAAQVDVLSGGRMRLGIGVGWNPVEYEGLDETFGNRAPEAKNKSRSCGPCGLRLRSPITAAGTTSTTRGSIPVRLAGTSRSGSEVRPRRYCSESGASQTAGSRSAHQTTRRQCWPTEFEPTPSRPDETPPTSGSRPG
jgi:hypothetical protein